MSRTVRVAVVVVVLALASVGISWASSPSAPLRGPRSVAMAPGGAVQVVKYLRTAGSYQCTKRSCGFNLAEYLNFKLPPLPNGYTKYSAVMTVSFDYKTNGVGFGGFSLNTQMQAAYGEDGGRLPFVPGPARLVVAAPQGSSTTLMYRPGFMKPSVLYAVQFMPGPGIDRDTNASYYKHGMTVTHELFRVDAVPVP